MNEIKKEMKTTDLQRNITLVDRQKVTAKVELLLSHRHSQREHKLFTAIYFTFSMKPMHIKSPSSEIIKEKQVRLFALLFQERAIQTPTGQNRDTPCEIMMQTWTMSRVEQQ